MVVSHRTFLECKVQRTTLSTNGGRSPSIAMDDLSATTPEATLENVRRRGRRKVHLKNESLRLAKKKKSRRIEVKK